MAPGQLRGSPRLGARRLGVSWCSDPLGARVAHRRRPGAAAGRGCESHDLPPQREQLQTEVTHTLGAAVVSLEEFQRLVDAGKRIHAGAATTTGLLMRRGAHGSSAGVNRYRRSGKQRQGVGHGPACLTVEPHEPVQGPRVAPLSNLSGNYHVRDLVCGSQGSFQYLRNSSGNSAKHPSRSVVKSPISGRGVPCLSQ